MHRPLDDVLATEAIASERRINLIRAAMLVLGLGVAIAYHFLVPGANPRGLSMDALVYDTGLVWCALLAWLLRPGMPRALHYVILTVDLLLVFAILCGHAYVGQLGLFGLNAAQADANFVFLFVVVATAMMRFSAPLAWFSLVAGLLALAAIHGFDVSRGLAWQPVIFVVEALAVLAIALMAVYVVHKSRELIARGVQEGLEKEQIKHAFSRYVTRAVAEEILTNGGLSLGGTRREVTLLFSDIRGFTRMSEHMPPEAVVQLLNAYFTEMVGAVFAEGGTIDKYMGDGLMAIFGAPVAHADHALRAVRAAAAMRSALIRLNAQRLAAGQPPLAIGIGLHSGECVIGNIGAEERLDYTAIGDTVNTASRIEGLTKEFGVDILMSATTFSYVGPHVASEPMVPIHVKGKTAPLEVFHLLELRERLPV